MIILVDESYIRFSRIADDAEIYGGIPTIDRADSMKIEFSNPKDAARYAMRIMDRYYMRVDIRGNTVFVWEQTMRDSARLMEAVVGGPLGGSSIAAPYDDGVGSTHPLENRRRKRKENFGMAGMPGGDRNDPEDPVRYEAEYAGRLTISPPLYLDKGVGRLDLAMSHLTYATTRDEAIKDFCTYYAKARFVSASYRAQEYAIPREMSLLLSALLRDPSVTYDRF